MTRPTTPARTMLFTSFTFLFAFLPIVLVGHRLIVRFAGGRSQGVERPETAWLVLASLVYYGYWASWALGLVVGSMLFNYTMAWALQRSARGGKPLLVFGVTANLALLGYYKYANFFLDVWNDATGGSAGFANVVLPIGISFFTFQQVAYLIDVYRDRGRSEGILSYGLFVSFFPQLIAGPIVHHKEMMPQFAERFRPNPRWMAVGASAFIMGLGKKVLLADTVAPTASRIFAIAESGGAPHPVDAWFAAIAYTFQIYFDFSGYSDMAVGLGLMFGVVLPLNFFSPYRATSIIEFWRRWHITLSRFLRDYLYIPLGGNRRGRGRRYVNLMLTMVLGGLWHGAGFTFIVWGFLHGLYLCVNHGYAAVVQRYRLRGLRAQPWYPFVGQAITFLAVVVAWVFFRAESLSGAEHMLASMFGWATDMKDALLPKREQLPILTALALICLFAPNTQQLLDREIPRQGEVPSESLPVVPLSWRPSWGYALCAALVALVAIARLSEPSEFIYYQF